jgi:predicted transcriptional regulator
VRRVLRSRRMRRVVGQVAIGFGAFMGLGVLLNLGQGHSVAGLLVAFGAFSVLPVALGVRALRSKERPLLETHARTAWDAELLRLAAKRDGSLTVTEVMAHADLDAETAERYLSDLCRRGLADPRVTDEGHVVYHFEQAPTRDQKRGATGVLDD